MILLGRPITVPKFGRLFAVDMWYLSMLAKPLNLELKPSKHWHTIYL